MSSDTEIDYDDVPFEGIRTRSQRATQSTRRTVVERVPTPDPDPPDSQPLTPFDHVFVNLIGWEKHGDCYQTLQQNHFTSIRALINNFTPDIVPGLKFTHPTLGRIFAPPVAIKEVESFLYFMAKGTDYYQSKVGEEYFLNVTTEQYEDFRKQYALENFEALKRNREGPTPVQNDLFFENPGRSSPTSASTMGRAMTSKVDVFRRERRDQSVYKVLKHDSQWLTWIDSTRRQAQAQRCGEVMESDYAPRTEEDELLFQEQNRYMIAVWDTVLKTDKARQILAKHSDDGDAQAVFSELVAYYTRSTHAKIASRELLCNIFSTRLDADAYSEPYEKFHIPDEHKMSIFQTAVKGIPCLNNVIIQADGIQSQTGKTIGYDEYIELLNGAAQVHDNEYKLKSKRPSKFTKRNVYRTEFTAYDSDEDSDASRSNDVSYEMYMTKTRGGYSPRLTKSQWESLPIDDRKIWDQLSDEAKSLIMTKPSAHSPKKQSPTRRVNVSEMTMAEFASCFQNLNLVENDISDDDTVDDNSKLTIHTANTSSSKHPAALKQMLTTENKKESTKGNRTVKYSERVAFMLTTYFVSSNEVIDQSLKPSLIDRGANGGVGGEDVKLLSYVPGRTVCIQGIDNHQMNAIRIGTVGGVVESTNGPLLLIFHQYAYTGKGASIHSAIQLESFGCRVDDRSSHAGGTQKITTAHGYILPLAIIDGLARLSLRPPTAAELDELPQEIVTSELDWDPRLMDSEIDESSMHGSPTPLEQNVGDDNLFNEFGDFRSFTTTLADSPLRALLQDVCVAPPDITSFYLTAPEPDEAHDDEASRSTSCSATECSSTFSDSQHSMAPLDVTAACQFIVQHVDHSITSIVPSEIVFSSVLDDDDELLDTLADAVYDRFVLQAYTTEQQVTPQPNLTRQYPDFEKIRPLFAFQPAQIVQKTFENTTQLARMSAGTVMKKHYKSPNPALNVERRKEAIATDTIFANVKALRLGVTEAQLFVGVDTLVTNVFPLKSQKHFAKVLMDVIIMHGAPAKLISDSAKSETSEKVKDICRTLIIPQWQSEANHQHQNYAERRIQDLKRISNTVLDRTGAPDDLWFECLLYVCDVLNHSFNERLNGIPLQLLDGHTVDISPFMMFHFYQRVLYRVEENSFPSESREELGYFVGISHHVGNAMTFKILTLDTRQFIFRSGVRSADQPNARNLRVELLRGEEISPPLGLKSRADVIRLENGKEGEDDSKQFTVPIVHPSDLIGRTFLKDDAREDGQIYRSKILGVIDERRDTDDAFEKHPERIKFRCSINNGEFEELVDYQRLMEYLSKDQENPVFWKFRRICEHKGPFTSQDPEYKGSTWNVKIEWEDGSFTWEPLSEFAKDAFVECAIYARDHSLLRTAGWKRFKKIGVKRDEIFNRYVNQAKLKSYRTAPRYKYGFEVPRHFNHAVKLDEENGNTKWMDSVITESDQLFEYDTFKDCGHKDSVTAPEGYKRIRCHFVFDVKHDGRHKARFVADGHLTDLPIEGVYSGVVSLKGIRTLVFLAELNGLQLVATDIGNAYLEAKTKERVFFVAGPEFGKLKDHILLIDKALYGLRTSGARWHDRFADVLRDMGFVPSKAEADIWMRRAGDLYDYIGVYVDDLLIVSTDAMAITDQLRDNYKFKLKGTGPVHFHLGMDFFRDEHHVLHMAQCKYLERMFAMFERIFGQPPKQYQSPLEKGDHPELDTSEFLDEPKTQIYQSLIGTLQWVVTIGKFDVFTAVMTMSSFRAQPRMGHMERVKRIYGYLSKFRHSSIRVLTDEPDFSSLPDVEYEWKHSVYGAVEEILPDDLPQPLGRYVTTVSYVDANLYHCMLTGKAVTGILHFLNKMPWDWYSKKQSTVETATYGSEFSAAKTATDQIIELRYMLRYLGVPIRDRSYLFGDNKTVVDSAMTPNARLHKRHNMLAFHRVRHAIASNVLAFFHIPGALNPSDVLSKHWGHHQVWEHLLKPLLFWVGDTGTIE